MPKFCANLTMLYTEHGFLDRFTAAAGDGFRAVEYMFPYPFPKEQLSEALRKNDLTQVLHNLPAGDWDKGDRGLAYQPDRLGEFQESVGRAVEYATALDCPQVNCLVGIPRPGDDPERVRGTGVQNLGFAAGELKKASIKLLIEPVNDKDVPGFWLTRADQAISVMDEVGSDNLFLQYDINHQSRMDGELTATFRRFKDRIAHVQVADNPAISPVRARPTVPFCSGCWIGKDTRAGSAASTSRPPRPATDSAGPPRISVRRRYKHKWRR
jgi:hydroxypyruvate isomerase